MRIKELDGLRAIAISAVLLYHFWTSSFPLGWAGVDLFFVISGFLITTILLNLRDDPAPFKTFYWRRVLRIFPAYYAVLGVTILLAVAHHEPPSINWLTNVFFIYSLRTGFSLHLIAHRLFAHAAFDFGHVSVKPFEFSTFTGSLGRFWSLSVEELFYLFWAPVVLKGSKRTIVASAIIPVFLCPIFRGFTHTSLGLEYLGFLTRLDTLSIGSCLALLFRAHKLHLSFGRLVAPIPLLLGALWLVLARCGYKQGVQVPSTELFAVFGYTIIALLFACVIGRRLRSTARARWLSPLRLTPFTYLGLVSYMVYLIHLDIYTLVGFVTRNTMALGAITSVGFYWSRRAFVEVFRKADIAIEGQGISSHQRRHPANANVPVKAV